MSVVLLRAAVQCCVLALAGLWGPVAGVPTRQAGRQAGNAGIQIMHAALPPRPPPVDSLTALLGEVQRIGQDARLAGEGRKGCVHGAKVQREVLSHKGISLVGGLCVLQLGGLCCGLLSCGGGEVIAAADAAAGVVPDVRRCAVHAAGLHEWKNGVGGRVPAVRGSHSGEYVGSCGCRSEV
jgi:hypothetical protein